MEYYRPLVRRPVPDLDAAVRTFRDDVCALESQETEFRNVTITVGGPPEHAYDRLCRALATDPGLEFTTNTYHHDKQEGATSELWPQSE
jgi:hypothetical protein